MGKNPLASGAAKTLGRRTPRASGLRSSLNSNNMSSAILLHKRVLISGLVSRPELNGTIATAMHWYESKGRYGVLFESGDCISLKAGNLTDLEAERRFDAASDRCIMARSVALDKLASDLRPANLDSLSPPAIATLLAELGHASPKLVLDCCSRIRALLNAAGTMGPWEAFVASSHAAPAVRAMADSILEMTKMQAATLLMDFQALSSGVLGAMDAQACSSWAESMAGQASKELLGTNGVFDAVVWAFLDRCEPGQAAPDTEAFTVITEAKPYKPSREELLLLKRMMDDPASVTATGASRLSAIEAIRRLAMQTPGLDTAGAGLLAFWLSAVSLVRSIALGADDRNDERRAASASARCSLACELGVFECLLTLMDRLGASELSGQQTASSLLSTLVITLDRLICDDGKRVVRDEPWPVHKRRARLASLLAIPSYAAALGAGCVAGDQANHDAIVVDAFRTVQTLIHDGRPCDVQGGDKTSAELADQWEAGVRAHPGIYEALMREAMRKMAGGGARGASPLAVPRECLFDPFATHRIAKNLCRVSP